MEFSSKSSLLNCLIVIEFKPVIGHLSSAYVLHIGDYRMLFCFYSCISLDSYLV